MDDIIIFSDDLDYLKEVRLKLEKELKEKYLLDVNKKKTFIVNIKEEFNFCGYRFRIINHKTVINVCKDTRGRAKRRIKEVKYLFCHDKMSFQSTFSSINTYYNGFKYGSSKTIKRLVDKYFFG